ncbi:NADAR family protein [Floccifex sp.]|uniref:NADAR family protein n=1 Tax=Floccifex sp. TaxID=2815810 RepID=UPI003F11D527
MTTKFNDQKVICFHKPEEENGYLSNWYLSSFEIDGISFSSMEQYMMYSKAVVFNDEETASKILKTDDVEEIKALGRMVYGYNESFWNGVRQIIVYKGLLAKFSQNEELKNKLKSTNDSLLAECAVSDLVWGIGLSMHDKERFNVLAWKGKNLLGYTLMMVRDTI